jgi:Protein of unknown function (DUF2914)
MSMERTTRVTALSALGVATFSLGVSAWSVGCQNGKPDVERAPVAVQTATPRPAAHAASSTPPAVVPAATSIPLGIVKQSPPGAAPVRAPGVAELRVKRLVVTHGISKREPLAAGTLLAGDGPLFAFVELSNRGDHAGTIKLTFEPAGGTHEVGHIALHVPAHVGRWRTWGRTVLVNQPGKWNVIVRDAQGRQLAREPFELAARPVAIAKAR